MSMRLAFIARLSSKTRIFYSTSIFYIFFIFINSQPSRFAVINSVILSVIILAHLLCCAIIISFNLVLLEVNDQFDLQAMASFYIMLSAAATNFVFCMSSEIITIALTGVGNSFYESVWYRLPICQQKLIAIIIARSQHEFHMQGLGLVDCSLYTFCKVICISEKIFSKLNAFFIHLVDCESRCIVLLDDSEVQMS